MNSYLIRLQLNSIGGVEASREIYGLVHQMMTNANATTTIRADDGSVYELPHAMYALTTAVDVLDLRNTLIDTVKQFWSDTDVLVILWTSLAWKLPIVAAAPKRSLASGLLAQASLGGLAGIPRR